MLRARAVAVFRRRRDVMRVGAHAVAGELAVDLARRAPSRARIPRAPGCRRPRPARSRRGRRPTAGSPLPDRRCASTARAPRQKPPMPSGDTVASAPPATMTSASPYSIRRAASPRLWLPVEHALTVPRFGPAIAVVDRHEARDHVDDRAGHEERRDLAQAALQVRALRLLDHRQAADARADAHAAAILVAGVAVEARVLDRFHRRDEAVVDERVVAARFLRATATATRRSPSPRRRSATETRSRRSA